MSQDRRPTVSQIIHAPPSAVYAAFLDAKAVAIWLPPGEMRGIAHELEGREGGALSLSLVYPDGETDMEGKTSEKTDLFREKIAQLISNSPVVWKTVFNSDDSAFQAK
jgi:hypothetical protein